MHVSQVAAALKLACPPVYLVLGLCPARLSWVLYFWAAFAALIAVRAWPRWDVGATSANINPIVVQAWTTFVWRCREWRFGAPENCGDG